MLGRAAYQNPELLLGVDPEIFGDPAPFADAFAALEAFLPAIARARRGERLHDIPAISSACSPAGRARASIGAALATRASAPGRASACCGRRSGAWSGSISARPEPERGVLPSEASRLGAPALDVSPAVTSPSE